MTNQTDTRQQRLITGALAIAVARIAAIGHKLGRDFDALDPRLDSDDRAHCAVLALADRFEAERQRAESADRNHENACGMLEKLRVQMLKDLEVQAETIELLSRTLHHVQTRLAMLSERRPGLPDELRLLVDYIRQRTGIEPRTAETHPGALLAAIGRGAEGAALGGPSSASLDLVRVHGSGVSPQLLGQLRVRWTNADRTEGVVSRGRLWWREEWPVIEEHPPCWAMAVETPDGRAVIRASPALGEWLAAQSGRPAPDGVDWWNEQRTEGVANVDGKKFRVRFEDRAWWTWPLFSRSDARATASVDLSAWLDEQRGTRDGGA